METIIPLEKTGKRPQVIKDSIPEAKLPLYEEAGKKTGFGVTVTARAGEEISVEDYDGHGANKGTFHTVKVAPGYLQIGISRPTGQEKADTKPFFDAVRELKQPPK